MIELRAGDARAAISAEGAEIKLWNIADLPLIWTPDPSIWPETAPILFPVVGWTKNAQVRVGETFYPLGLHGFARHRRFDVVEQSASHVRFALQSDPATRALYPFDFRFTVEHRLTDVSLETVLEVYNNGDGDMPYACGVHPGFRWPFAGGAVEDYRVIFDATENADVPVIVPGGLISEDRRRLPLRGRELPLLLPLFEDDALVFLNSKSHGLRFTAPNGAAIALDVKDFPHLALWCRPGAGYLCLEAWTGYSDPADFSGDLFTKPSMRRLPPQATARHAATYSYEPV
ncbi:MAG TPA: aldose 1-epimerase family protein [Methylovirgula sp.]|jgi:galactose mutarotase-like enzyme|nr:aldose 1-epimerase family protein [Methylovirgula sp.]